MEQNDVIKGMRLQNKDSVPTEIFTQKLKNDLMKNIKSKNNSFFGLLTLSLLAVIVALTAILLTNMNKVSPNQVQTAPTITVTPSEKLPEETPVTIKTTTTRINVTSVKTYVDFTYPETYNLTFSYNEYDKNGFNDDSIKISLNGNKIITVVVNGMGYDGGVIPMKSVSKISTKIFGDVYRFRFNTHDSALDTIWYYAMAKAVKLTGTCHQYTANPTVAAPCIDANSSRENLVLPDAKQTYFRFACSDGNQSLCDILVSGLVME